MIILEFIGLFAFILVFGYLIPAGQFYFRYQVRKDPNVEPFRIQERRPSPGQVRREVKSSLLTIFIFASMSTILWELYKAGKTSIYVSWHDYPVYWIPLSLVLSLVIHDTYFYWLHRFMHWRPVFKYLHLEHHRSVSPTPWAIYAFNPLEAILQFLGVMGLVIFLPMRPVVLLGFLAYDTLINTAGHTGYEMVPKSVSHNWFFRYFNTVTNHDDHHTNVRVNYGAFFNIWDRLMGTFQGESTKSMHGFSSRPVLATPFHSDAVDREENCPLRII